MTHSEFIEHLGFLRFCLAHPVAHHQRFVQWFEGTKTEL
jgi:hypothetical protein